MRYDFPSRAFCALNLSFFSYFGSAEGLLFVRTDKRKDRRVVRNSIVWTFLPAMLLVACSHNAQPAKPKKPEQPSPTTTAPAHPAAQPGAPVRAVSAEMRNVMFHLTPTAAAHLMIVSGELWPTGNNEMVVFDDKASFEVRVANGTVAISPAALSDIMNNFVFARKDAPLKDIKVSIDSNELAIKGKLRGKGDLPFATAGTLSVTGDGLLRVHTQQIAAMHVPVKKVMGLFGIELAHVLNTSKIPGITTDKDDLIIDLGALLPPPHIRGKLSAVRIEKNGIVTVFGDGGDSLPRKENGSYMAFQGSRVRFGNLMMDPTDLTILGLDEHRPLDWDQDDYRKQLEAGYTKITPSFGLRAYAQDYGKLSFAVTHHTPPSNPQ